MPLAQVHAGLSFYYEDSGPLEGEYITVVMVHGTGFHADIFGPMLPYAASNQVRLILVNRRDYPGSTPFSSEELEELSSADLSVRANALSRHGMEMGLFLAWLVRTQGLPPVSVQNGGVSGGVSLVAWSLAHTPMAGLLAYADQLPDDVCATLRRHLRSYCVFDSPHCSYGFPTLSDWHPLVDATYPAEARVPRFYSWVSTYYTHSLAALDSHNPKLLDTKPLPFPEPLSKRPATLEKMTPGEIQRVSWPDPIATSEAYIHGMPLEICWEQTRRMLFDKSVGRHLPDCKVVVLWGANTLWEPVGAAWTIEKVYKEKEEAEEVGRVLEVVEMPDANHFPHWDEPEKMVQFLASVL